MLGSLLEHCSHNDFGLSFMHMANPTVNLFLFLELTHKEGKKVTRNNFNLHVGTLTTGQFCHLKKNCSKMDDYKEQSQVLVNQFMEKGYPKNLVKKDYIK